MQVRVILIRPIGEDNINVYIIIRDLICGRFCVPKPYTSGIWALYKQANLDNVHPNGCFCQECFILVKKLQLEAVNKRKAVDA